MRINPTAGAVLLLVAALGACSSAPTTTPTSAAPSSASTYTENPVPPQPTPIIGKYANVDAMVAKVKAAGVPLVADKMTYMNDTHTDVNGVGYAYGSIGAERVGFFTFDWPTKADASERQDRQNGTLTYRGDGWIVSAKTPATLTQLTEVLNK